MTFPIFVLGFFFGFMICGIAPVIRKEATIKDLFFFGLVGAVASMFIWKMIS